MQGTTVCPHCNTRFKITKVQLEAHHGMVRCGNCLQAFDTLPNFAPDQLDLPLELQILESPDATTDSSLAVLKPMTLAEQVVVVQDEEDTELQPGPRSWPWAIAALLLLLILLAQAAYFFRVDIAAQLPALKPLLVDSCRILKCSVPLPQHADLINIESSAIEADPANENRITLNVLLRNRASYAQAFPNLELTLNSVGDQPLARRIFRPTDYLPITENQSAGLGPNHELNIKLHLNTTNIKPSGYRLVLLYSGS
ncbi:MAG: zinc-ribbon and DUF3426 domain-containing protein [Gallionella sp.]